MTKKTELDLKRYTSERHTRTFDLSNRADIDEEKRTVRVAFSSDAPLMRSFGNEILDHDAKSVRLDRIRSAGAVLVDHEPSDHVGTVEEVSLDADQKGRALLRFGRSARAVEVFNDVVDGIRKSISVGYRVYEMTPEKGRSDDEPSYRVTDWEPLEISLVSIPFDPSAAVGRDLPKPITEGPTMEPTEQKTAVEERAAPAPAPKVDLDAIRKEARSSEMTRIRALEEMGRSFDVKDQAQKAIQESRTVEQFQQEVLGIIAERNDAKPGGVPALGMSDSEVKQFSFVRAMASLANPDNRQLRQAAAFENEVSEAAQAASGRSSMGFMVPPDVLKRDLNVGTDTAGGHTVATDLGSLIDMLRNRSVVSQVGSTMLTGLQGNLAFPRQTGGATGYWVAEGGAPTESQQTFDQVPLSPKTCGAFTEYTRQLLQQSSIDIERFVRDDLASQLALAIDLAALYGTAANNQPRGVSLQTGINAPTDFVGANPTFAEIVAMETAVAEDNADQGNMAYVCRTTSRGYFKSTEKFSGTGQTMWEDGGTLNGYNVGVSNQVTAGDIFFGNWADLLIGMWGGLDIMVNPYALDTSGGVRIVALQSMDIAVRRPVSFAFNQPA